MARVCTVLLLLGALLADCSRDPAGQDRAGLPTVDSLVQREVDREHIPGAVVRIQRGDSVLHEKAYGYAQKYRFGMKAIEDPEPMTTGHLFDLASLTKVFGTTIGVMMLADRGEIGLDDPVREYLQGFDVGEKRQITIRHLLTHSAGLYQWKPTYYFADGPQERLRYVTGLPLRDPIGEDRHYSDLGFMLLGDIIERVSGQPLDGYLEERLYGPLQLTRTAYNPLDKGLERIAATSHGNPFEKQMVYDDEFGYRVDVDPESWDGWRRYTLKGEVNDGNAWYTHRGVAGHAGLFSTAGDLQVLVRLLIDKGKFRGRQLIPEAVVDTFLTKDRFGNGLGWAMDPAVFSAEGAPAGSFGHTGFTGTSVAVMPEYDLSVILLTNRQNVGRQENGYYFDLGPLRQAVVDTVLARVKLY